MRANVEAESDVQHELEAKVWLQRIFAVAQLLAHVELETDLVQGQDAIKHTEDVVESCSQNRESSDLQYHVYERTITQNG